VYVNWEGTVYSLCIVALNSGWGALRKMVLLLVSLIEMVGVGYYLSQVMNQIGDVSCVTATEEGKFLT